jgi:hypothetical protein
MSPQHAKSLARILTQKVEEYEANIGPLPSGEFPTDEDESED